jgi:dihydroxyacetone kinase
MLDSIVPFVDELARGVEAGASVVDAWTEAARVATRSAERTADLLPRAGRARTHLEKSLGTPDAGAVSFALSVNAVAQALAEHAVAKGR